TTPQFTSAVSVLISLGELYAADILDSTLEQKRWVGIQDLLHGGIYHFDTKLGKEAGKKTKGIYVSLLYSNM
ncbi:hypothetical protein, partial [Methanoculleus sp.]|uniref:hypothetical protein n=1 Tax=Methanoculleus sp. TaxID=90427 RepID=UPI00320F4525